MTVHSIVQLGDSVLRKKAKRVTKVGGSIDSLIDDMMDSMYGANGVGLAAPQIGISLRVIVIGLPEEEPFALINPEIVKRSGRRIVEEGCLSIVGYHSSVSRSVVVVTKGLDRHGKVVRIKARDNLLAHALEHEVDHIDGVLYVDRLESLDLLERVDSDETFASRS